MNNAHATLWLFMAVQRAQKQILKSLGQTQECWPKEKKKKKKALIYSHSLCSKFPSENKERYIWSLGFVQNIKAFSFLQSLCCRTEEWMLCEELVSACSLKKTSAKTWLPWNIGGPRDLICSEQVRGSDLIRRPFLFLSRHQSGS